MTNETQNQEVEALLDELCVIAGCYGGAMIDKDLEAAQRLVLEYQECIERLYAANWNIQKDGYVSLECLLPDEYLPKQFAEDIEPFVSSISFENAKTFYEKRFPKKQFPQYYPPNFFERLLTSIKNWLLRRI